MEGSVTALPQRATVNREGLRARVTGYALSFSAVAIVTGLLWDISWHMTIGRDTFWTAAHMVIYLGGLLGGLSCAWLILTTTFAGSQQEIDSSVRVWGFRGPLGAWATAWGAAAMLTSAPFDDWWHGAYGLDVEILSPPHTVLAAGMFGIIGGAILLALSNYNRGERKGAAFGFLYLFCGGVLLTMAATLFTEHCLPNQQHTMTFYVVSSFLYPVLLTAIARGTDLKWAATVSAGCYMGIVAGMGWLLEQFPGHPLLGPIYRPVDHMVPPAFPLVLLAPALAIDILLRLIPNARPWALAAALGTAFLAVYLVVQWNFSSFLISEAADNAVFMSGRIWSYADTPGHWQHEFWHADQSPITLRGLAIALGTAVAGCRAGIAAGAWMRKVRR